MPASSPKTVPAPALATVPAGGPAPVGRYTRALYALMSFGMTTLRSPTTP